MLPLSRRAWAASAVVLIALLGCVLAVSLDAATGVPWGDVALAPGWTGGLAGLATVAAGGYVLWRRGADAVGIVLTAFGLTNVLTGVAGASVNVALARGATLDGLDAAVFLSQRLTLVPVLAVPTILVLLPDSRLPGARLARVLAISCVTLAATGAIALLLAPSAALEPVFGVADPRLGGHGLPPALGIPTRVWTSIVHSAIAAGLVALIGAFVVLGTRRGDAVFRLQARWLGWAAAVYAIQLVLVLTVVPYVLGQLLGIVATTVIIATTAIVVTRTRLSWIDRVITWTVVSGALVAAVLVLDLVLVMTLGALIEDETALVIATVTALLVYTPLRDRLVASVGRIVSGSRGDPFQAASELGERLELAPGPVEQLGELAAAVRELFGARAVQARLALGDELLTAGAGAGSETEAGMRIPLPVDETEVGELIVHGARRPALARRDRRLLAALVRQAVTTIRAATATAELRDARERLVVAREEERLRLHRDLHDGLGPVLAGVRMRVDAARNLAHGDPRGTSEQLAIASGEIGEAIETVRRAVVGLRPPALDEVGLEGAIRRICDRLDRRATEGIAVSCEIGELPSRTPAVDVACAYLVGEAVANAVRHSGGRACRVDVRAEGDTLRVRVDDDGRGLPRDAASGTGLVSMRERVEEIGGMYSLTSDTRGTRLEARLPLGGRISS